MATLQSTLLLFLKEDRSAVTNRNYASCLTRMVQAVGPARHIGRVTYADLLDFADTLKAELSPSSFRQYLIVIKTFFNWCVRLNYLKVSPVSGMTARVPPRDPSESRAIPPDLLDQMLDRCRYEPRDYALIMFLADTAGRRGAVATLTISNLELAAGRALVTEKGNQKCWVYFGEGTAAALSRWLAVRPNVDHDFVFTRNGRGTPLKPDSISSVVRRISRECCGVGYGPHSIRHSVAERWVEAGASPNDVQHKLNHKRLQTTIDNYFPRHNRNVEHLSRKLALPGLKNDSEPAATNIIRLDVSGL